MRHNPTSARVNQNELIFHVRFSEDVVQPEADDWLIMGTASTGARISRIEALAADEYLVTVSIEPLVQGEIALMAKPLNNIKDTAGNNLQPTALIDQQGYRLIRNGISTNWASFEAQVDSRSFILDIEFEEASENQPEKDMFSLTNAEITQITKLSDQSYRLNLNALRLGTATVQLAANKLQIADNIFNRQSPLAQIQIFVDEQAPEVVINGFPQRDLIPGENINLQFIFSEAIENINQTQVALSGMTLMDFTRMSDNQYSLMLSVAETTSASLEIQAIHVRDLSGNQATSGIQLNAAVRTNTAPVLTVPAAIIVGATGPQGTPASNDEIQNFLSSANAIDAEDGNLAITHNAPATFPIGVTLVRFSAVDGQGEQTIRFVALES